MSSDRVSGVTVTRDKGNADAPGSSGDRNAEADGRKIPGLLLYEASWPGIRRRRLKWAVVHRRIRPARLPRWQTRRRRRLDSQLERHRWCLPQAACRGLARRGGWAARLPEEVEVEEEAADLAAARACQGIDRE